MKILCAGRNYAEHAVELKNAAPTTEPVLFMKPESALILGDTAQIPSFTTDMHYECELVLRIGTTLRNAAESEALAAVDAVTVGLDFTARDVQARLKNAGLPWELAKAFDGSAAAGRWVPLQGTEGLGAQRFSLRKSGEEVQIGHAADMIFSPAALLSFASRYFTLHPGDLFFTGTPAGVGQVAPGDVLEGFLGEERLLKVVVSG